MLCALGSEDITATHRGYQALLVLAVAGRLPPHSSAETAAMDVLRLDHGGSHVVVAHERLIARPVAPARAAAFIALLRSAVEG